MDSEKEVSFHGCVWIGCVVVGGVVVGVVGSSWAAVGLVSTISQLSVCSLGGGVAVGGRGRLGLGRLWGLSVYTGFLLGFWRGVEWGHRYKSVPLVLRIHCIGLLCLQTQHK